MATPHTTVDEQTPLELCRQYTEDTYVYIATEIIDRDEITAVLPDTITPTIVTIDPRNGETAYPRVYIRFDSDQSEPVSEPLLSLKTVRQI